MAGPRKQTITRHRNAAAKRAALHAEGRHAEAEGVDPECRAGMFLDGILTFEDMDIKELETGRWRDKNGGLKGPPGQHLVPRKYHLKLAKELMKRTERDMLVHVKPAIDRIGQLITSPRTPAREALAASVWMIERVNGKTETKSTVNVEVRKFEELAESGALLVDLDQVAIESGDIVDAEIVNDLQEEDRSA